MNSLLQNVRRVHCIGIGGIAISGIAKLLRAHGITVTGSDKAGGGEPIPDDAEVVVYSEAVPDDDPERVAARERELPSYSGARAIAELTKGKKVIAVTGTNGKSTTTAMLANILIRAGWDPTALVGSKVPGWELESVRVGASEWFVLEADEYARKLLQYSPFAAVITNIEKDHLDVYRDLDDIRSTFQIFIDLVPAHGIVILNESDEQSRWLVAGTGQKVVRYRPGDEKFKLKTPGAFNRANATAAAACARALGVDDETIRQSLEEFPGIWRRFEIVGSHKSGAVVVSDYGHHPTAVAVTIAAAREAYPNRRIVLIFQPHHHNRTIALFDEFVRSVQGADVVILPEIYDVPGREEGKRTSSNELAGAINKIRPDLATFGGTLDETSAIVESFAQPNDLLLFMGAGDIDRIARAIATNAPNPSLPKRGTDSSPFDKGGVEGVRRDEPMAKHTTLKLGGPAKYFLIARTRDELVRAIETADRKNIPYRVIGGGANTLVADAGFDGLIIKTAMMDVKIDGSDVHVGSGMLSVAFARKVAAAGLSGLEWLVTLPGTIGGAVYGNAGCFGSETKDRLVCVEVFEPPSLVKRGRGSSSNIRTISNSECQFSYRDSFFKHLDPRPVILSATFKLDRGNPSEIESKMKEFLAKRAEEQPLGTSSAGCLFKNPLVDGKRTSAGMLIEKAGLKGFAVGPVCISDKHGNFGITRPGATAADLVKLIQTVKARVRDKFGIELEEEVQYIGNF